MKKSTYRVLSRNELSKMENVTVNSFTIDGVIYRKPTEAEYKKDCGTSASGLYRIFTTNGISFFEIKKRNLIYVNFENARILFNS